MTTWYRFYCQDCGFSGLTRSQNEYKDGRRVCPQCGSLRFEVELHDAAPLPEEEDLAPELDD